MSSTGASDERDPAAKFADLWRRRPAWARIAGLDDVFWCPSESVPSKGERSALLEQPVPLGRHVLLAPSRFPVAQGQCFWTLFRPALSANEGWLEYPHELATSALVECRVLERRDAMGGSPAWPRHPARLLVVVCDAIPLYDIARRFPPDPSGETMSGLAGRTDRPPRGCASGDLRFYEYSVEGDAGVWQVCQVIQGRESVILLGDWAWDDSCIYAGHRPLTDAESLYCRSCLA